MFVASYLQRSRHGIFYFRIAIPHALRAVGTSMPREIKKFLQTCDRATALIRARAVHVRIDQLFSEVRQSMDFSSLNIRKSTLAVEPSGKVKASDIKPGEEIMAAKAVATTVGLLNAQLPPTATPSPAALSARDSEPERSVVNRAPHKLADKTLPELVRICLGHYKTKRRVKDQTFRRYEGHLKVFVEYFGDCKISAITRAGLTDYWDDLALLPRQNEVHSPLAGA